MTKKIIGAILLAASVFIASVLLTYGGPVFPHITGPIILAIVGIVLVVPRRKA